MNNGIFGKEKVEKKTLDHPVTSNLLSINLFFAENFIIHSRLTLSFRFCLSKRYVSKTIIELTVLVIRLDGREDVLIVHTYLVDAKFPSLCGKQMLEN